MKCKDFLKIVSILAVSAIAASCATTPGNPDPWEPMNRKTYAFNDSLDRHVLEPTARGYQKFVPRVARTGVHNFFQNLDDIKVVVNDVLQLKLNQAARDSGRFLLNTTVGVVGLFDVASEMGLYKNNEDFGQTLGYWGVGPGPYLVVPLMGNTTTRDAIGMIPDAFLNPIFWVDNSTVKWGAYVLDTIDTRVQFLTAGELRDDASDQYIYVRDAVLQRREYLVNDGVVFEEDDWESEFD